MTITADAGWGNLPLGNWDQVLYAKEFIPFFRRAAVAQNVTNTKYSGLLAPGSSVKIMKEPEITVSDYARGTRIVPQDFNDEDLTLAIDTQKYVAFNLDDLEAYYAHNDWFSTLVSQSAYKLKDKFDADILQHMATNGSTTADTGTDASSTSAINVGFSGASVVTPGDLLATCSRILDENDVDESDRYVVFPSKFKEYLFKEDSKLVEVSVTGDSTSPIRTPMVGMRPVHGFNMFKSNNIGLSTNNHNRVIFGHKSAVATAIGLHKSETVPLGTEGFGKLYKELHVWGKKIIRPEACFTAYVDFV